jgi:methionyl-tRNA formyltransferase
MDKKPRIVFMGTPAFAVASLSALLDANMNVVGVVTAPDKPGGRGMQLQQSAVKQFALAHNLPLLQPEKLKDPAFFEALNALKPDLQVVVAFRMLPEIIWSLPPMGTLNVHGSLLPQYRGAAPINWAIMNGEKETGVTTFQLQHAIDTGDILLQDRITITENMTAGELHDKMMIVGANLLVKTLNGLIDGAIQSVPQNNAKDGDVHSIQHAPKIFTTDYEINWDKSVQEVHNHVRGLAPFPGSITKVEGKIVKLYSTLIEQQTPNEIPGSFVTDGKTFAKIACNNGYLLLNDIQWEGKKKMPIVDFLRGYRKS